MKNNKKQKISNKNWLTAKEANKIRKKAVSITDDYVQSLLKPLFEKIKKRSESGFSDIRFPVATLEPIWLNLENNELELAKLTDWEFNSLVEILTNLGYWAYKVKPKISNYEWDLQITWNND